jgi:hypothetical protein
MYIAPFHMLNPVHRIERAEQVLERLACCVDERLNYSAAVIARSWRVRHYITQLEQHVAALPGD